MATTHPCLTSWPSQVTVSDYECVGALARLEVFISTLVDRTITLSGRKLFPCHCSNIAK